MSRRATAVFSSYFFHNSRWTTTHLVLQNKLPLSAFKQQDSLTPARLLKTYAQLSKTRLSVLNVLVAMTGVAVSPLSVTLPTLLSTALGTALCCASANTLNQIQEVPFDAQMARTRNRPLVRRAISPLHATGFALATGFAGPLVLLTMVNPVTAILGASNIALYAGPYTWMKRKSIANTWVGSVVGAVPTLIGWTATGAQLIPSSSYPIHLFLPPFLTQSAPVDLSLINNPLAPFAFFMLLFSWQFPHFNSISYIVRGSYAQAGYRMLSVLNPAKNAIVALRHSFLLVPICSVLVPLSGLTTWSFALTSLLPNAICIRAAWSFWRIGGENQARALWRHCLWYLPAVLGLMMFHKQGVDWFAQKENEKDIA